MLCPYDDLYLANLQSAVGVIVSAVVVAVVGNWGEIIKQNLNFSYQGLSCLAW
ncbi:hypothetical protein [Nostoc sp.]|uniref:hypothetical protein n=1 Tax=Nostoc sp. TaxID=1180 RepID=UPI002FF573D7